LAHLQHPTHLLEDYSGRHQEEANQADSSEVIYLTDNSCDLTFLLASSKPSGGLFGSSSGPSAGGSTFGKPSGGLFGSSTQSTTAAPAFGGGSATGQTSGGGLFGASKPSGGLFGSSAAAKPSFGASSGGAFGSSSGSTFGSGSSFGQKTAAFGGGATTPAFGGSGAGSTFGSTGTSGGLFSSSGASGSLFGQSKFGATQPATAQPTPVTQQVDTSFLQAYTALNQDPYGTKGIQEVLNLKSFDVKEQEIIQKIAQQVLSYKEDSFTRPQAPSFMDDPDIFSRFSKQHVTPITLKLNRRGENEYSGSFRRPENPYLFKKSPQKFDREREAQIREMEYNRVKKNDDYLMYTSKFLKEKENELNKSFQPEEKTRDYSASRSPDRSPFTTFKEDTIELTGPNIVKVKVGVFIDDTEELLLLSIDKSYKVADLIKLAIEKLKKSRYVTSTSQYHCDIESSLIQVIHKSRILNVDSTLEESGVESGMTFTMLVQEQPTTKTAKNEESTEFVRKSEKPQREERRYVSRDKLPI
jgi:hypothetical protein